MRIKIKGMNDPIQSIGYEAEDLVGILQDSSVPRDKMLTIGDLMVKKSEIIAVLPDTELSKEDFKYDMSRKGHRETIYQFEKEFNEFIKNNPDKYFKGKDGLKVGYKEHWRASLGITTLEEDYKILNPDKYKDFQMKWSALQDVRIFREKKTQEELKRKQQEYQKHANEVLESMKPDDTPVDQIPF